MTRPSRSSSGDRDRRKGSRQGSSQRCDYNNLATASGPGQVCRGRAALSAGDRDRRKDSRQGSSRRCDPLQQSRLLLQDQGKYDRGRAALSAGDRDRRKGSRQGSSRPLRPATTTSPSCFRTRASMPRPSRSIGGRSRSTKRLSARIIPTLRPVTTTSPACFRTRASMTEAEPLYRRAMEIFQTKLGLDHPNTVTVRKNYDRLQELKKQNSANPTR